MNNKFNSNGSIPFEEIKENERLAKLNDILENTIADTVNTIGFPNEFPIIVDIVDDKSSFLLIGDINNNNNNSVISIDDFSRYIGKDIIISPTLLMAATADSDTVTRFINQDGLLAFNAIGGGGGGVVIHDDSLKGNGLLENPLGINTQAYQVKKIKEGSNITILEGEESGTWIISSSGGGGGGDVVHDTSLTGKGTQTAPLGIDTTVYKVQELEAGSNIDLLHTGGTWKISSNGGTSASGIMSNTEDSPTVTRALVDGKVQFTAIGSGHVDFSQIDNYQRVYNTNNRFRIEDNLNKAGILQYFNFDIICESSTDGSTFTNVDKITYGIQTFEDNKFHSVLRAYNSTIERRLDSMPMGTKTSQIPAFSDFDPSYFSIGDNKKIQVTGGGGKPIEGHKGIDVDSSDSSKYVIGLGTWNTSHPGGTSSMAFINSSNSQSTIYLYNTPNNTNENVGDTVITNSVRIDHTTIILGGQSNASFDNLVCDYNDTDCKIKTKEGDIIVNNDKNHLTKEVEIPQDTLIITKDFIALTPDKDSEANITRILSGAVLSEKEDIPSWGDFSDAFELDDDGKITFSSELEWARSWSSSLDNPELVEDYSVMGIDPSKGDDYIRFFTEYYKGGDASGNGTLQSSVNILSCKDDKRHNQGSYIEVKNHENNITRNLDSNLLVADTNQVIAMGDMNRMDFVITPYDKEKNVLSINKDWWKVKGIIAGEGIAVQDIGNGNWIITNTGGGGGGRTVEGTNGIMVDSSDANKYVVGLGTWKTRKEDNYIVLGFDNTDGEGAIYIQKQDLNDVPIQRTAIEDGRIVVERVEETAAQVMNIDGNPIYSGADPLMILKVKEIAAAAQVMNIDGNPIYSGADPLMILKEIANVGGRELNALPLTQEDTSYVPSWGDFSTDDFQITDKKITIKSSSGNSIKKYDLIAGSTPSEGNYVHNGYIAKTVHFFEKQQLWGPALTQNQYTTTGWVRYLSKIFELPLDHAKTDLEPYLSQCYLDCNYRLDPTSSTGELWFDYKSIEWGSKIISGNPYITFTITFIYTGQYPSLMNREITVKFEPADDGGEHVTHTVSMSTETMAFIQGAPMEWQDAQCYLEPYLFLMVEDNVTLKCLKFDKEDTVNTIWNSNMIQLASPEAGMVLAYTEGDYQCMWKNDTDKTELLVADRTFTSIVIYN